MQDGYCRLSIQRLFAIYEQKNAKITLLKILTHSVAGCVTFCFEGCFVKCFLPGSVLRPVSFLSNCYSTRRRCNYKNQRLCRLKVIVIFVGGHKYIIWASTWVKPVFLGLRTTKAQTSLHIHADWSSPLLFVIGKCYIKTCCKWNFRVLASLYSWRAGLNLTLSETLKTGFLMPRPI